MASKTELAWAAGFFDGEGYITGRPQRQRANGLERAYPRLRIAVAQCDPEVLNRFLGAVRLGKVKGPYAWKEKPTWSPKYYYECSRPGAVMTVVASLWSYLSSIKRQQAKEAILEWRKGAVSFADVLPPKSHAGRKVKK